MHAGLVVPATKNHIGRAGTGVCAMVATTMNKLICMQSRCHTLRLLLNCIQTLARKFIECMQD